MRRVTIGASCIDTTVGAFVGNTDRIIERVGLLAERGCHIAFFQEMGISGYPAEDLVQWREFVDAQAHQLERIRALTDELKTPMAVVVGLAHRHRNQVYNSMALVCEGGVRGIVPKQELPTYGVFYDGRVFSPGVPGLVEMTTCLGRHVPFGDVVFDLPWGVVGVAICEDMWRDGGPIARRAFSGAELILDASASPYRVGVSDTRSTMIRTRSADAECVLCYVNQVGGNDALSFDGGFYIYQNGGRVFESERFVDGAWDVTVDLDQTTRCRTQNTTWRRDSIDVLANGPKSGKVAVSIGREVRGAKPDEAIPKAKLGHFIPSSREPVDDIGEMVRAMLVGLDGYYGKAGTFSGVCIALSGGRDSMLTTLLANDWATQRTAHGPRATHPLVRCYSMPSVHNSDLTRGLASTLCDQLGVAFHEEPIQEAFEQEMAALRRMTGTEDLDPLAVQNAQARIRAMRMWNISNQTGALWLQCGNMSEKATGYTTIGGDLMGGYSLLGNMPKTVVNETLRWYARLFRGRPFSDTIDLLLESPASAELASDQQDERDLMPFEILDACYALFAGEKRSPQEVYDALASMHTAESLRALAPNYDPGMLKRWVTRFVRLFFRSIYKWISSPEAVHLFNLDLDRERALQIPSVTSLEWMDLEIDGEL